MNTNTETMMTLIRSGWASTPRVPQRLVKKTAFLAAGCVTAAGVAGGGIAYANAASSSGAVYTACLTTGRTLYNVTLDGTPKCSPNDTTITWNQTGPRGEPGAEGPQGATGPAGPE